MNRQRLRPATRTALPVRRAPRRTRPSLRQRAARLHAWTAAYLCGLAVTQTHAAGGHHAVDDAAIVDPGQCQIETWADRRDGERSGYAPVHLGPACRVGPVELGLNLERERGSEGRTVRAAPQLKWAHALSDDLGVGLLVAAAWERSPERGALRYTGASVVVPLTWQIAEDWRAHFNLGRDLHRAQPSRSHSGLALEWTASQQLGFVAERFREGGASAWRAGLRWTPTDTLSIDLSRAHGLRADRPGWWTLGMTWAFRR